MPRKATNPDSEVKVNVTDQNKSVPGGNAQLPNGDSTGINGISGQGYGSADPAPTVSLNLGGNKADAQNEAVKTALYYKEVIPVKTREDYKIFVGGVYYSFKANRVTSVPRNVAIELNRQGVTMPV